MAGSTSLCYWQLSRYVKARNETSYGALTEYDLPSWTQTGYWPTMRFKKAIVTAGPIIKGNFVDPNQWSYEINYSRFMHGYRLQEYISGSFAGRKRLMVGTFGNASTDPGYPTWDRVQVYNRALERLNAKVRGDLDLSIAIAEAGTTARMIKSLSKVLSFGQATKEAIRYARRVQKGIGASATSKRGDRRRGRNKRPPKGFSKTFGSTKDLANGWLQWQYGWKPLCNDVFAVADESIRIVINRLQHFRAGAKLPVVRDDVVTQQVNGVNGVFVRRQGTGKQACHFNVTLTIPSFDLARWSSLNPVSIAWELIPYSFVVDWFYDVGSYLRNLETALLYNTQFRTGYVSELFVYDGSEDVDSSKVYTATSPYRYSFQGTGAKIRYRKFARTKLTSYPLPRIPRFTADLGAQRLISAASLLRQLLK